jgi:hypothetical protein
VSTRRPPGLDRLRPRNAPDSDPAPVESGGVPDADGKRALFSAQEQSAPLGAVTVACSRCGERTVVSARRALGLLVPSVHLPLLRPAPWSYLRCPACHRLAWVELTIQL